MSSMLDVAFLGGLFPGETEKEIYNDSISNIQNAANTLQWSLVKGFDKNLSQPISIINSLYIGSFPKRYKKAFIRTYNFMHSSEALKDINVGFLNLPVVKNFSRYYCTKPLIKKWAMDKTNIQKVLIAYAMSGTFVNLIRYAKEINPNIVTCLVVPDLPQYMHFSDKSSAIFDFLKSLEIKQMSRNMKYIDCYVLLTEYMRDALKITKPYVVVEGISTDSFSEISSDNGKEREDTKTIVYSGGLNRKYGVLDLVNSFKKMPNPNYRLVICGYGEAEEEIIEASEEDNRIVFKGLLKREEVLRIQKSATVLVNPRANNEEYTKYSFPSKIMEYLSSGTPVIAYKLDGMPDEYRGYIYLPDEGEDGLYKTLLDVLSKTEDELLEKGLNAREFVLEEKNSTVQTEKILKMIEEVIIEL